MSVPLPLEVPIFGESFDSMKQVRVHLSGGKLFNFDKACFWWDLEERQLDAGIRRMMR